MKSLKEYKHKLDHRLGYCMFACLVTIGVIMVIFGLLQETAHEELSQYIQDTRQLIVDSWPQGTTTSEPVDFFETTVADVFDDENVTTEFAEPTTTIKVLPETCLGSEEVDSSICLTAGELQDDYDYMHSSHIALWNLAILNIIVAILLIFFTVVMHKKLAVGNFAKLAYRGVLLLCLFFMAVQLVFLISPLLLGAFYYPSMVDKLFEEKFPREKTLVENVESRFACQFEYVPQLVELSLQRPCGPHIKNALLSSFAVILLIFFDIIPFLFVMFTYAWDAFIKDAKPVKNARMRIELNNQRRPQSREDILKRTMEEP